MKRNLLFLSPTLPSWTGNGSAMRAAAMVEALAENFSVHLIVLHYFTEFSHCASSEFLARACATVKIVPKSHLKEFRHDPSAISVNFSVIHVFKLFMVTHVEHYWPLLVEGNRTCYLDLDDFESKTHDRFAKLAGLRSEFPLAQEWARSSARMQRMEQQLIPKFERVFVCSRCDEAELARTYQTSNIAVVPNVVRTPLQLSSTLSSDPPSLLFIATMHYYPNFDAAQFFCDEILPLINQRCAQPVRVGLVGGAPHERTLALAGSGQVQVIGGVKDVEEWYHRSTVVIVPLRAGGGTRIKILEAASYAKAIVSTSVGAEGLEVTHGEQLLLADTPDEFAAACVRLIEQPILRGDLGRRACEWVRANHSMENFKQGLRIAYADSL